MAFPISLNRKELNELLEKMDAAYNLISEVSTNLNMNGEFELLGKVKTAASKVWTARAVIQNESKTRREN